MLSQNDFGTRVKYRILVQGSSSVAMRYNLFLSSLRFVTHLSSRSSLTLLCADLMDSWTEDTGNSILVFPLQKDGCLLLPSPERFLNHVTVFMNDRTRLLVTCLSPSVCFTTVVTVDYEDVPCPMRSQSSKDMLNLCVDDHLVTSLAFLLQHA